MGNEILPGKEWQNAIMLDKLASIRPSVSSILWGLIKELPQEQQDVLGDSIVVTENQSDLQPVLAETSDEYFFVSEHECFTAVFKYGGEGQWQLKELKVLNKEPETISPEEEQLRLIEELRASYPAEMAKMLRTNEAWLAEAKKRESNQDTGRNKRGPTEVYAAID